ncbi:MAG: glutamate 5-kinase [Floccifex porci]|uniref:Glutamate 5-kinase n=1 Tax=Floccifex porci TaxID=2606629 RepID=A0A7X2T2U9_9FIRM|nr:glutamate 5-kinase [Floccifex porci]MDD7466585.1 glutamate 5-kinase [Floccifex porci]MDY4796539.1 glutamate 5-kinase [Floccifex porci]MSS00874.1 glutamate 5-kinase [Floccifex porci]
MRVVVKVGSSTLTHPNTGLLNIRRMESLCRVLSDIKNEGNELILVSSGAIAMGMGKLGLKDKPDTLPGKQAVASIGQCELMYTYDKLFSEYNHTVGQVLLTKEDIEQRKENCINTIEKLLKYSCIPIINENDTISTSEIEIGDNDTLGAVVSKSLNANLYIILSDINGLYTSDPSKEKNAKLIQVVDTIDDSILKLAGDSSSKVGTGGMITKLQAAQIVTKANCDMVIANGKNPDILYDIMENQFIGTLFKKEVKE